MKHLFFALGLMTLSVSSLAAPQHIVLCEKQQMDEEVGSHDLLILQEDDIAEIHSLSPFWLKLVNHHIRSLKYADKDLAFEEVQLLFGVGEYASDDLYILSYQSQSTGVVYYEVVSYPGDNRYGFIYDTEGDVVAKVEDGDVFLQEDAQEAPCPMGSAT